MCHAFMYMLVFVHVSLECKRLTVLFGVLLWNYDLAACYSFHLWRLKQPCSGCLDMCIVCLGSTNMPIMPSQVSLKTYASLSSLHL